MLSSESLTQIALEIQTHLRRVIRKWKCHLKKGQRQRLKHNYLLYKDRTETHIYIHFSILSISNDPLYESLLYVFLNIIKSNQVSKIKNIKLQATTPFNILFLPINYIVGTH